MAKSRPMRFIGGARATGAGQPPAPVDAPAAALPQSGAAEALPPGAIQVDMNALLGALQDETTAVVNMLTQRSATNSAAARRLVEQLQAAQNDAAAARAETAKLQQELAEAIAARDVSRANADRLERELSEARKEALSLAVKWNEATAELAHRPIAARVVRISPKPDSGESVADQPEPDDTPALAGDD